jgi:hypothetical protein
VYIKNILRHEIAHAYEDIVSDLSQYKNATNNTQKEYYNSDTEIDAYLNEFLSAESKTNHMLKYHVSRGDRNSATQVLLNKLAGYDWIRQLTKENKKWVMKTVYTYVAEMVDKAGTSDNMNNEVPAANSQTRR